jgi:hypothetical protein
MMKRYLTVLGVAIMAFGVAGGSIAISGAYNDYRSQLHVSGDPASNPLTVLGEVKWQATRLIGGAIITGSVIAGSVLLGLGWIGDTLERILNKLTGKSVPTPHGAGQA